MTSSQALDLGHHTVCHAQKKSPVEINQMPPYTPQTQCRRGFRPDSDFFDLLILVKA